MFTDNLQLTTVAITTVLAVAITLTNHVVSFTLSPVAILLGGSVGALNILFYQKLVSALLHGGSGRVAHLLMLVKLPALLVVLYVVTRQGSMFTLSFLVGFLTFIPATFIQSYLNSSSEGED